MRRQRIYSAGELSQAITRKLTLSNLAIMLALFTICVAALNVYAVQSTNQRIDAEMERRLQGFTNSHLSAEEHSQRLPGGLLPIIYFLDSTGAYTNPHPSDLIIEEDIDLLLARDLPEGFSTQYAHGRAYRTYVDSYDPALTFWEQGAEYLVSETISFQDITSEDAMLHSLQGASVLGVIVSALLFAGFGFVLARRALVPINEAWEKQRRFAADTSHELRNPLTVIKTNAELLLHHPNRTVQEESEHVAAILDSSNRMSSMLGTLLTLARADADEDEVSREHVDLTEVLDNACAQFQQIGAGRDIALTCDIARCVPVLGDRKRLVELFSILLDNAIRYTPRGGAVRVACARAGKTAVVTVTDTGVGMSPPDFDRVFQRFYRSSVARDMNPEGTGLGLPIAQWIAERHSAELHIESEAGRGTTVTITFPTIDS